MALTEHLIVNRRTGEWSAITIDDHNDTAMVVTSTGAAHNDGNPLVLNWTKTMALTTLAYCQHYAADMFDTMEVR